MEMWYTKQRINRMLLKLENTPQLLENTKNNDKQKNMSGKIKYLYDQGK